MTKEEINKLIAQGEGIRFELKASIPHPDIIARHISSFANTEGGLVIFGVEEPAKVVGVDEVSLRKSVENAQRRINGETECKLDFTDYDGKRLGLLSVMPSKGIVAASGAYYKRIGESIRPITADELRAHLTQNATPDTAITELTNAVSQQSKTIEQLRDDFQKANSPIKKILLTLGGAAGGQILKMIIEHFFN
ncbi:MAG TPA: ATP-binding protein [Blastocatellia bacterium]|nr:ATP-binding protein [Blastocatellia bacterium]HMZ22502.1 ATP-binding protein [Blastocatellia bacterium]HNG31042.1 ATP-binding protein [Blastocatellia bacterium]